MPSDSRWFDREKRPPGGFGAVRIFALSVNIVSWPGHRKQSNTARPSTNGERTNSRQKPKIQDQLGASIPAGVESPKPISTTRYGRRSHPPMDFSLENSISRRLTLLRPRPPSRGGENRSHDKFSWKLFPQQQPRNPRSPLWTIQIRAVPSWRVGGCKKRSLVRTIVLNRAGFPAWRLRDRRRLGRYQLGFLRPGSNLLAQAGGSTASGGGGRFPVRRSVIPILPSPVHINI